MSSMLPPVSTDPMNREKLGYFGRLGSGAGAQINFLQTAVSPEELEAITLIENIPGSESWDVRDLFQRDVDKERVGNQILPYFKDSSKVKFFNPLTLTLLAMDNDGRDVEKELTYVDPIREEESGHHYQVYRRDHLYEFKIHEINPAFSKVRWNANRVRLVAIDGQHRLSALMRWKREATSSQEGLPSWVIPVVILGMFKESDEAEPPNVLEIVRRTFVYINSKAERVNEARRILLDDESANCICTQELIQQAHSNDSRPPAQRDPNKVPLIFFDWRGATRDSVRSGSAASIKNIEEIKDWFECYLLGDDGSEEQSLSLELDDLIPPLDTFGEGQALSHKDAERVRNQFRSNLLPGLAFLLENFAPYRSYISECRKIEAESLRASDLAIHAFSKLRFGSSRASEEIISEVELKYTELKEQFTELKSSTLPELLSLDIGMRGVVFAFSDTKCRVEDQRGTSISWLEHAKWFIPPVNKMFQAQWFDSFDTLDSKQRELLLHIPYDASGGITNYKLNDVKSALGPFVTLLTLFYAEESEALRSAWDELSVTLRGPLTRGYRRHHRALLKDHFTGTQREFKKAVEAEAKQSTEKQLDKLKMFLGV